MKKLLGKIGGVYLLMCTMYACSANVPNTVQSTFTKQYSTAKDVTWQPIDDNGWLVSFYTKPFYYNTVYYHADGSMVYKETAIAENAIPLALINFVHTNYPNCTIANVYKHYEPKRNGFVIELQEQGKLYGIYFSNGKVIGTIPANNSRFTSRILVTND